MSKPAQPPRSPQDQQAAAMRYAANVGLVGVISGALIAGCFVLLQREDATAQKPAVQEQQTTDQAETEVADVTEPTSSGMGGDLLPIDELGPDANAQLLTSRLPMRIVRDHFPEYALSTERAGWAIIACNIDVNGTATCSLEREASGGLGFGRAALRLATNLQFDPALERGIPVERTIKLRFDFGHMADGPAIIVRET